MQCATYKPSQKQKTPPEREQQLTFVSSAMQNGVSEQSGRRYPLPCN